MCRGQVQRKMRGIGEGEEEGQDRQTFVQSPPGILWTVEWMNRQMNVGESGGEGGNQPWPCLRETQCTRMCTHVHVHTHRDTEKEQSSTSPRKRGREPERKVGGTQAHSHAHTYTHSGHDAQTRSKIQ